MAVERLTDYTRRIWTALDADAPEGHDIHVNDVIYYMDSSQCGIVTYVYPEGSIDVEFLPDVGGGGDIKIEIKEVRITNLRTSSVNFNYLEGSDAMPGVFPVSKNVLANDTATITKMGIQDGYFNIRFTVGNIKFTYNGEDLPVIQGGKNNYYYAIPYVGNDYAYEMS